MKTAIYIEEGVTQLALTPENDFEKSIVSKIHSLTSNPKATIHKGTFYLSRGGWHIYDGESNE